MDFLFFRSHGNSLHPSNPILFVDHDAFCKTDLNRYVIIEVLIKNYGDTTLLDETNNQVARRRRGHWRTSEWSMSREDGVSRRADGVSGSSPGSKCPSRARYTSSRVDRLGAEEEIVFFLAFPVSKTR
jgi:hypothetical protein